MGAMISLLTACGGGPSLQPLAFDARILAFGNSLTFGTGARRNESYPAVLSKLIGREVINAGVPGEITAEGRARLAGLLDEHAPQLVILCHGGNDMLRKLSAAEAEQNLRAMIAMSRAAGAEVVLVGVPNPGIFLSTAELYERVAETEEVALESEVVANVLGENNLKSDAVHPNARGYRQIAEALAALLRESGALE